MATLARMAVEQTLAETLSCRRVLLVEDDRALNELLTEFLELQGLEVTAVESGDDALRELEGDAPPDIVLLDLRVPGISGGEVLRRMKQNPRWSHIPVAAMTGMRPGEFHLVADPDEFLAKPFDIDALSAALVRMCEERHS
ncbi:MAG TPA: response regulator [Anaeromyxobacteraceae bacterium]